MARIWSFKEPRMEVCSDVADNLDELMGRHPLAVDVQDVTGPCLKCGCPAKYAADHECGPCPGCHGQQSAWHQNAGFPHTVCKINDWTKCYWCRQDLKIVQVPFGQGADVASALDVETDEGTWRFVTSAAYAWCFHRQQCADPHIWENGRVSTGWYLFDKTIVSCVWCALWYKKARLPMQVLIEMQARKIF